MRLIVLLLTGWKSLEIALTNKLAFEKYVFSPCPVFYQRSSNTKKVVNLDFRPSVCCRGLMLHFRVRPPPVLDVPMAREPTENLTHNPSIISSPNEQLLHQTENPNENVGGPSKV